MLIRYFLIVLVLCLVWSMTFLLWLYSIYYTTLSYGVVEYSIYMLLVTIIMVIFIRGIYRSFYCRTMDMIEDMTLDYLNSCYHVGDERRSYIMISTLIKNLVNKK